MWDRVGDRTELQYIDPSLLWPSALYLSRSPELLNRRPGGSLCWVRAFSTASCQQRVSKLTGNPEGPFCWVVAIFTHLVSNSLGVPRAPSAGRWLSLPHVVSDFSGPQLSDFLFSPSYIIVQSLTQSLEWHVWSSSSGNNCHAVHRSLSPGASVYECTMGFLPCPIFSAKPAYAFSSHKCHRNVSLPSGASLWNGIFGQVDGQYTTPEPVHISLLAFTYMHIAHKILLSRTDYRQRTENHRAGFKSYTKLFELYFVLMSFRETLINLFNPTIIIGKKKESRPNSVNLISQIVKKRRKLLIQSSCFEDIKIHYISI